MTMYVDYKKLKSLNKSVYMLVGPREVGKTYGWKLHVALRDFVKKGYKFVFARRYQSQVKLEKDFWGSVADTYERNYGERLELTQKGTHLFVNGKHAGIIVALSQAVNLKSQEWVNYRNFALDEFIELQSYQYLGGLDEPAQYFWKVIGSIFRYVPPELAERVEAFEAKGEEIDEELTRDLSKFYKTQKIYMFANAERMANPYFIEFGIVDKLVSGERVYTDGRFYVELLTKSERKKTIDTLSPIKNIIQQKSYGQIYNTTDFPDNKNENINSGLVPNTWGRYQFGVIVRGVSYFVHSNNEMQYFITNNGNKNAGKLYSMDMSGFDQKHVRKIDSAHNARMINIVNTNRVTYNSLETRETMLSLFGNRITN